jgi:hypothetical protein
MAKKLKSYPQEKIDEFIDLQEQVVVAQRHLDKMEKDNPGICLAYFHKKAQPLFENNPRLYSFSWKQYTPSWNDGDTCYFSAHTDYPDLNGVDYWNDDEGEEDYDKEAVGSGEPPLPLTADEQKTLRKNIVDFFKDFQQNQLEHWFGDGAKITVTKKTITVDDYYDEDY